MRLAEQTKRDEPQPSVSRLPAGRHAGTRLAPHLGTFGGCREAEDALCASLEYT